MQHSNDSWDTDCMGYGMLQDKAQAWLLSNFSVSLLVSFSLSLTLDCILSPGILFSLMFDHYKFRVE